MPDYTILIVDYDPHTLEPLSKMLEEQGHRIEVAKDGIAAIEVFNRVHPDLTLIEFMLPKKSGLEVCLELRSTPHGKSLPIVIMSSRFRSRQYRSEARHRFRADEFIEKPIDHEKMTGLLERYLSTQTEVEIVVDAPPPATPAIYPEPPALADPEPLAVVAGPTESGLSSEINDRIDSLFGD